ncbi:MULTISPECIES: ribonuclease HepT family protein [Nostocales]|uniref:Uncharacterized protein n=1 Tax=Dolichospermum planctonicum TaxID=136072 RepID=A0A480A749_9CYAN|nr:MULTISPECIES: hypothetical protein [Nostocales]GCL40342.1 hypothetical protein NIES80_00260 [Dolichospermum planctonicum]
MKDERLYLSNIQECIERIEEYTKGGKEERIYANQDDSRCCNSQFGNQMI